jgi:hypothetical protein
MRDLFKRLNNTGFPVDISTFSKANTHRSQKPFIQIYQKLYQWVNKKGLSKQRGNYRDLNKFQDQTKPKEALYNANTSRFWFNHSTKRKDIAVRNASNASTKVFKGLFAHLRLNPPVKVCHKMKV